MDRRGGVGEPQGRNQNADQSGKDVGHGVPGGISGAAGGLPTEAVEEGSSGDWNESRKTEQDAFGFTIALSEKVAAGGEANITNLIPCYVFLSSTGFLEFYYGPLVLGFPGFFSGFTSCEINECYIQGGLRLNCLALGSDTPLLWHKSVRIS